MVQGNIFERFDSDLKLIRTVTNSRASLGPQMPRRADQSDVNETLLSKLDIETDPLSKQITFVVRLSLIINILLLFTKLYVFALTHSKAVLASFSDSVVDICCQVIITIADHLANKKHPGYPVGRTRLETMGVILCAVTMSLASAAVIEVSVADLIAGFQGQIPELDIDLPMYILLGLTVVAKLGLFFACVALAKKSDVASTLAVDHRNDVLSNTIAIVAAFLAATYDNLWWADPVGAVLVSLYIIYSWLGLATEQIGKLVGMAAPDEFTDLIRDMGNNFHESMKVDIVRAYHLGPKYVVEVDVVLPTEMTVRESHDIALSLQVKVESLVEVERAFVHVDYRFRQEPEHKVDRLLRGDGIQTIQEDLV